MCLELDNGITVDKPDIDGEICINVPPRFDQCEESYCYLSRESVVKILELFGE